MTIPQSTPHANEVTYSPEQVTSGHEVNIAYDSYGDPAKPPVLLIMGLATQLVHWHPEFCKALAQQGFWVIRFDNRDIGHSSRCSHLGKPSLLKLGAHRYFKTPFQAAYTLDDMTKDVIHLMDHLHLKSAHVIGVSMGGMIAQLLALNYPKRVKTLTAVMSSTGDPKLMRPEMKVLFTILKPQAKTRSQHIEQTLAMWKVLHGDCFPFPEHQYRETITLAYERGISPGGVLRQMAAITASPDRTPRLSSLTLPSLIIHGDTDNLLRVKNGIALTEAIPGSHLHIIKGMGHTLPRETWSEIIEEFVKLTQQHSA